MLLLLLACAPESAAPTDGQGGFDSGAPVDQDADGWAADVDCNDHDPSVHPDADEAPYDGVDQDCDGADLLDADTDGVAVPDDCDDADPAVHPGADERCDGQDADCDGAVDDDPVDGTPVYADADADGHGDPATATRVCDPAGLVQTGDDCDDADATVHPGASELACDGLDNDCDADTVLGGAIAPDGTRVADLAAALALAASGDTVTACEGAHVGPFDLALPVTVHGLPGAVLHGDAASPVLTVEDALTLDDVTVTGGASDYGGCVRVVHDATFAATDTVLTGCTAGEGGGIYAANDAQLVLTRVDIRANTATRGGGVALRDGVAVTAVDVTVAGNTADEGGGLAVSRGGRVRWSGGTFSGNTAEQGGGMDVDGTLTLDGAAVRANTATAWGGGLALMADGSAVDATDLDLSDNIANDDGGGAYVLQGSLDMVGGRITGNRCRLDGGGVYVAAWLTLDGTQMGSGADDNAPDDVTTYSNTGGLHSYTWEAAATASCSAGTHGDGTCD